MYSVRKLMEGSACHFCTEMTGVSPLYQVWKLVEEEDFCPSCTDSSTQPFLFSTLCVFGCGGSDWGINPSNLGIQYTFNLA